MPTLILVLFAINCLVTMLQLSIFRSNIFKFILPGFWASLILLIHPVALKQNINLVTGIWQNPGMIVSFSALQIIEAIPGILLCLYLMRLFNGARKKILWTVYELIPSITLIAGLFVLEVWLFLKIDTIDYLNVAIIYSVSVFWIMLIVPYLITLIVSERELRNELKLILLIVQLAVSMIIVILSKPLIIPADSSGFNLLPLGAVSAILAAGILVGYIIHKIRINRLYR